MPGFLRLAAAAAVLAASVDACLVGERQEQSCSGNAACCKYTNSVEPSMTEWSCFKGSGNVTASQICDKLNGTVIGGSSCYAGELTDQSCSADASCCCSYSQSNPSGAIDATVCTSSQLCSILKGSC